MSRGGVTGTVTADLEIPAQRFAYHRGCGFSVALRSLRQRLLELGLQPDGLNPSGASAHRRTAGAPAQRLLDVVASLRLVCEFLDQLVGDRLAARGLFARLLRHVSLSGAVADTSASASEPTRVPLVPASGLTALGLYFVVNVSPVN
jgi:hypothetical protein